MIEYEVSLPDPTNIMIPVDRRRLSHYRSNQKVRQNKDNNSITYKNTIIQLRQNKLLEDVVFNPNPDWHCCCCWVSESEFQRYKVIVGSSPHFVL